MACWDIVGKAVDRPVHELLGGRGARAAARLHLSLSRGRRRGRRLHRSRARRRACRGVCRAGLHGPQVRPAGAYATLDPRQPSLEALERSETLRRLVREAVGDRGATCSSARTASSRRRARSGSRGGSSRSTRSGSRSPLRRRRPEQMARGRPSHVDPDRDRRAADDEARVRACARDRRGVDPAAEPRARRRPARGQEDRRAWRRRTTRRSRRTSTAGRWSGRRTSSSPPAARTSSSSRASATGAASTPRSSDADRVGGRLRRCRRRARPRRRARRGGRRPASLRRRRAASRAAAGRARSALMPVGFVGLGHLGAPPCGEPAAGGLPAVGARPRPERCGRAARSRGRARGPAPPSEVARAVRRRDHVPALTGGGRGGGRRRRRAPRRPAPRAHLDRHEHERPARAAAGSRRSPPSSGVATLEAPVTGGVHRAAAGEITVLVGGDGGVRGSAHAAASRRWAVAVFHVGPLGSASTIKVITNMLAFIHLVAGGEALMLAQRRASISRRRSR